MTLEDILGMSSSQLAAMTDAELLAFFQPKLSITRPTAELRTANVGRGSQRKVSGQLELLTGEQLEERRLAVELAKQIGVDISDILPT